MWTSRTRIYYQIYAEDGGTIPSKSPVTPGDPFLGRIKARSVPPPRTVEAVKGRITKVENIKGGESTSVFLTQYNHSPMDDADMVFLNGTDPPGSTPQYPLALVVNLKISDSERSALESEGRGGLASASAAEPDTMSPEIRYVFYRIYAEDGAIPSKTSVTPSDPFLGRIKAISVRTPRTVKAVKGRIKKVENIKGIEGTSVFLTPYSESPMDDADKFFFFNGTSMGSTPEEPLALVAKMSDSERRALESDGRGELASAVNAKPDTTIQYLYYLLYALADDCELPSKVAIDPDEPSLGRILADSVAPPHSPTSIKRCISRVEGNPELAYADLFADTESDTPLKEGHISTFRDDWPDLSPNEPMAIVQAKNPLIPDGRYLIKNRAKDIYWHAGHNPINTVYFFFNTIEDAKKHNHYQWEITKDNTIGNISIKSLWATSSWVGAGMSGSRVPVPWRLILADDKSYYLTTDMNHFSQNPRVPVMEEGKNYNHGSMATLKEGDQWQMWEFIRI